MSQNQPPVTNLQSLQNAVTNTTIAPINTDLNPTSSDVNPYILELPNVANTDVVATPPTKVKDIKKSKRIKVIPPLAVRDHGVLGKRGLSSNKPDYSGSKQIDDLDDDLMESSDNKAKKGVKRQKLTNDKVSRTSLNDTNAYELSDMDDELKVKDNNIDLPSQSIMQIYFQDAIKAQFNIPANVDLSNVLYNGFNSMSPQLEAAQQWFIDEQIVPKYIELMVNSREDSEVAYMLSKLPYKEHITVIIKSIKLSYSDPAFPKMKYMAKLFALCQKSKGWESCKHLAKEKDDKNLISFITEACNTISLQTAMLSINFITVVASLHCISVLIEAFIAAGVKHSQFKPQTKSEVTPASPNSTLQITTQIQTQLPNITPPAISPKFKQGEHAVKLIMKALYLARYNICSQAFRLCVSSGIKSLINDSVFEVLENSPLKQSQLAVIQFLTERVDLKQINLDLGPKIKRLITLASVSIQNVHNLSKQFQSNDRKLRITQKLSMDQLEYFLKEASEQEPHNFQRNVIDKLKAQAKNQSDTSGKQNSSTFIPQTTISSFNVAQEIDLETVKRKIDKLLLIDLQLKTNYDIVEKVAQSFVGQSHFNAFPYQTYVAAQSISDKNKHVLCIIPTGMGKTIIMAIAALTLLSNKDYSNASVCFITLTKDLARQMEDEFNSIFGHQSQFSVWYITQKADTMPIAQIYFVDESDKVLSELTVESDSVIKNNSPFYGILQLLDKDTYWFSATVGKQQMTLLSSVFKISTPHYFPSQYQIQFDDWQTKMDSQWEIQFEPIVQVADAIPLVINQIKKDLSVKPIMIFCDSNEVYAQIKSAIGKAFTQTVIQEVVDYDYVQKNRQIQAQANTGIFMMGDAVKRGISLRLGKEAVVYVINNNTWSMSDCQQMIGRGCRSMGRAHGFVFSQLDQQQDSRNTIDMLQAKLKQKDNMSFAITGIYILAGFVNLWNNKGFNLNQRKEIFQLFSEKKWLSLDYDQLPAPDSTNKKKFDYRNKIKQAANTAFKK